MISTAPRRADPSTLRFYRLMWRVGLTPKPKPRADDPVLDTSNDPRT
jgi:hypothetical protein